MSMGARIKVARQSREWSQSELATQLGTSQTCVHNWEADNTFPRPANLKALAKALGVTPRFLEEGEGRSRHDGGRGSGIGEAPARPCSRDQVEQDQACDEHRGLTRTDAPRRARYRSTKSTPTRDRC